MSNCVNTNMLTTLHAGGRLDYLLGNKAAHSYNGNLKFQCTQYMNGYKTQSGMQNHVCNICKNCRVIFPTQQHLQKHNCNAIGPFQNSEYLCKDCHSLFTTQNRLKNHKCNFCKSCDKIFSSTRRYKSHICKQDVMVNGPDDMLLKPIKVEQTVPNMNKIGSHTTHKPSCVKQTVPTTTMYTCTENKPLSGKQTIPTTATTTCTNSYNGNLKFQCTQCMKGYKTQSGMQNHVCNICKNCRVIFRTQQHLQKHNCNAIGPFQNSEHLCKDCHSLFTTKNRLKNHKCKFCKSCDKIFSSTRRYKSHICKQDVMVNGPDDMLLKPIKVEQTVPNMNKIGSHTTHKPSCVKQTVPTTTMYTCTENKPLSGKQTIPTTATTTCTKNKPLSGKQTVPTTATTTCTKNKPLSGKQTIPTTATTTCTKNKFLWGKQTIPTTATTTCTKNKPLSGKQTVPTTATTTCTENKPLSGNQTVPTTATITCTENKLLLGKQTIPTTATTSGCTRKNPLSVNEPLPNIATTGRLPDENYCFVPTDLRWQMGLCSALKLPLYTVALPLHTSDNQPIGTPNDVETMKGDGNCFFRAISFVLTGTETYHSTIRSSVVAHTLALGNKLKTLLPPHTSAADHVRQSKMKQDRQWVTEIEIFATAHLLRTDIYTYTEHGRNNMCWMGHAVAFIDTSISVEKGIYLRHTNNNHYDVVRTTSTSVLHPLNSRLTTGSVTSNKCATLKQTLPTLPKLVSVTDNTKLKRLHPAHVDHTTTLKKQKRQHPEYADHERALITYGPSSSQDVQMTLSQGTNESSLLEKYFIYEEEKSSDKSAKKSLEKAGKLCEQNQSVKKRKQMKIHNEIEVAQNQKDKERKTKERKSEDSEDRESRKSKDKVKHRETRKTEDSEDRERRKSKDNVKHSETRKSEDSEDREHRKNKDKVKHYQARHTQLDACGGIEEFKNISSQGPVYVCALLYRQSVIQLRVDKYGKMENVTDILSLDYTHSEKVWVCSTCDKHLLKGKLPPQNRHNNLYLDAIPAELKSLSSLESRLIAQRIPFMKISARPRGGQKGITGAVVNVPMDTYDTVTHLPRPPPNSEVIMLKLKRKLQYKSSALDQVIRPKAVMNGLDCLMHINPLYANIKKNEEAFDVESENENDTQWYPESDNISDKHQDNQPMSQKVDYGNFMIVNDMNSIHEIEDDNPSTSQPTSAQNIAHDDESTSDNEEIAERDKEKGLPFDTCLQPSDGNEIFSIAPAEGNIPFSLLTDPDAEHLSFPALFPKGQFGYTHERKSKLHHRQYLNSRLLNVDGRFATCTDYIFFSQFHAEKKQIVENVQIALRKTQQHNVMTAGSLRSSERLQTFLSKNVAYMILKNIRGSPAYWQRTMYDLLGMVRQLGKFTWFLTLSSADMRWPDIMRIIAEQNGIILSDDDVRNLTWDEKCKWLRNNPVTAARHFDYKVQQLFKVMILKNKVLGDVKDYFIRTEFQQRGSPHVHCVLWVTDAPVAGQDPDEVVCDFVNKFISCQLPVQTEDSELHLLVSSLQKHSHTRTCRKAGQLCRFHFPKVPVPFTMIAHGEKDSDVCPPAGDSVPEPTRPVNQAADSLPDVTPPVNHKEVLRTVGKVLYDNEGTCVSLQQILQTCGITENEYVDAVKASETSMKIFYKREPSDVSINNYNSTILKAWEANMDIQYVTDVNQCIKYIVSYVTKDEAGLSDLLRNASKQASDVNLQQQLKNVGNIFLNHREVSAQEAIYRVLPIPLRRTSTSVIFVPTDLPEDRVKLVKPSYIIEQLDDESEEVFCNSLIDRYIVRPDTVKDMCLAEFASLYTSYTIAVTDDSHPDVIDEEPTCKNNRLKLKNNKGYMRRRKEPAIIRTHQFSKFKQTEKYFHSKLMLYIPFRNEDELKQTYETYEAAFTEQKPMVTENQQKFEKKSDEVDAAFEELQESGPVVEAWDAINSELVQADLDDQALPRAPDPDSAHLDPHEHHGIPSCDISREVGAAFTDYTVRRHVLPDEEYRGLIRTLNVKQRQLFEDILTWCRSYLNSRKAGIKPDPFYTFITGGAGTGKSVLIKAIYNMAVRELQAEGDSPEDCTVLLMAPTGTAAFNINGTTLHTALKLPLKQHTSSGDYLPLSQEKLQLLRCKLQNLTLVIIDEISMVSAQDLYTVHRRLMQLKGVESTNTYFGGICVIAVGDLYQLPPVGGKPVYGLPKSPLARLAGSLWMNMFKTHELDEIMRQKDDKDFALLLNRIRTQQQTEDDVTVLRSRLIDRDDTNYPFDVLHMFATNREVDAFNEKKMKDLNTEKLILNANDIKPSGSTLSDKISLPDNPNLTGGLAKRLVLGVGARVMITKNIDISDGLVNGTQGEVVGFYSDTLRNTNKIVAVIVKCDNIDCGTQTRVKYRQIDRKYPGAVPIFRDEVNVNIGRHSGQYISRQQFPLRLSWACTIHKTQGMTLAEAVVSIKGRFFPGQCYVALSRVSSLSGLYITEFSPEKIKTSQEIVETMSKMHDNQVCISCNPVVQKPSDVLSISLLNVRSMTRHAEDIQSSDDFRSVDICCFTETWLTKKQETPSISDTKSFRCDRSGKRSGGVVMYVNEQLDPILLYRQDDRNLQVLLIQTTVQRTTINLAVVYVSVDAIHSSVLQTLLDMFTHIPTDQHFILLGDFNKVIVTSHQLRRDCIPLVSAPTCKRGSVLDQVYISTNLNTILHMTSPYFSDHQIKPSGLE